MADIVTLVHNKPKPAPLDQTAMTITIQNKIVLHVPFSSKNPKLLPRTFSEVQAVRKMLLLGLTLLET